MPMELLVQPQELAAIGQRLLTSANEMNGRLNELQGQANPEHCFHGHAAKAYWDLFEQWRNGQAKMIEALDKMGPMLQKIAKAFEDHDLATAGSIANHG